MIPLRPRRVPVAAAAGMVGIAAAVFTFAYDHGGYAPESRDLAGVLVWAAVLFGLVAGFWRGHALPPAALVAGTCLTALAAFAGVSAAWAPSTERALDDFCRTLLYSGVFVFVALSASRRSRGRWLDGLALGIAAVAAVALVSRFFPSSFGSGAVLRLGSGPVWRLSFPVGYWNGLAVMVALGVPLLLGAALMPRHALLRGLALTPLPAFAALIYLTSSRGGTVAAAAGIFVFFAGVPRRAATVAALAVVAPAAVAAVALVRDRPEIVNGPFTTALARQQGHAAALWIVLACLACGLVYAGGLAAVGSRLRVGARLETALLVAGIVAAIVTVVALHPARRFDDFRRMPSSQSAQSAESHLLSGSGTGRWQLWTAAIDQFRTRPVAGQGAGSYERWQTRHGTLGEYVQDAHSLYLQTLGELGVVGLVLVAGMLTAGFTAGAAGLRSAGAGTSVTAAAVIAVLAAFSIAAAFDWIWQLPAVAVVGVITLALATAGDDSRVEPAAAARASRARRAVPTGVRPWGAAVVAISLAAVVAEALPLLSQLQVDSSRADAAGGDLIGAVQAAERARALTPWNATPYVQVALVAEQGANYAAARAWIDAAIRRDASDWRLWITAARIEAESGRVAQARRSLARARVLNPRLPLVPVRRN